jgi:hypothetical protein
MKHILLFPFFLLLIVGSKTVAQPTGATISGMVYHDVDGSGTYNGDPDMPSIQVALERNDTVLASQLSDGNGNYTFGPLIVNLPGTYKVTIAPPAGYAVNQPYAAGNHYTIAVAALGESYTGRDFGLYDGVVGGTKFNDLNNDGVNNDHSGFPGFTIEVHRDSCNGALYRTGVTIAGGVYSIPLPPGTWYLKEVNQAEYRQTYPWGNCQTVTVSGPSGGGGAHQTGVDFGNFKLNTIHVRLAIDQNGNGVKDGPDSSPVPHLEVYEFTHNGIHISYDTLGLGVVNEVIHNNLDTGVYVSTQVVGTPAGWVRTYGSNAMTYTVTTSAASPNIDRLDYKPFHASGRVFEDHNGDGDVDSGEVGIPNWTVTISGIGGGTVVTDTSGNWQINDIMGGAHTISIPLQVGYLFTSPPTGAYTFTSVSGVNQTNKNFGVYVDRFFRTARYEDWALTVDAKNKPKSIKRKPDKVFFGFNITAPASVSGFILKLNMNATGLITFVPPGPDPVGRFINVKEAEFTVALGAGQTVLVNGIGFKGKKLAAKVIWQTTPNPKTVKVLDTAFEKNDPGLPYPNLHNVGEELFGSRGTNVFSNGLRVGIPVGPDSASAIKHKKYKDVMDSFVKWARGIPTIHDAGGRCLDDIAGHRIKKLPKSYSPAKEKNLYFAELLTLKLNVAASAMGIFPIGLGELTFFDETDPVNPFNPFNGMMVRDIVVKADSIMSCYNLPPYGLDVLYATASRINNAFFGPLDTVSFSTTTSLKGVKRLSEVPYLHPTLGVVPVSINSPKITNGTLQPNEFTLQQNYPNPFNPTTMIGFELADQSIVTLKVYNMLGQEVTELIHSELMDEGTQEVEFDASRLSSGVYFYRLMAQQIADDEEGAAGQWFTQVKKMMLLK